MLSVHEGCLAGRDKSPVQMFVASLAEHSYLLKGHGESATRRLRYVAFYLVILLMSYRA